MLSFSVSKNRVIPRRAKPDVGISYNLEHLYRKSMDFPFV